MAEQLEADLGGPAVTEKKPAFRSDDMGQTAVVMAVLAGSTTPLTPGSIASTFRQGKRAESKVGAVLDSLSRMGIIATVDSGRAYHLRRSA